MNSSPHIGHAFEFILADALTRFLKKENHVHFNVGLDEHGIKVWNKSIELSVNIDDYLNKLTSDWKIFCDKFDIDYSSFYKTSDTSHHDKVKVIWNRFVNRGDIYKKKYIGKYCEGCESFKLDKELSNGKCLDHITTDIKVIEEENYFFRLTKYKESILKWIDENPNFITPSNKINELRNLTESSEDISISRLKQNCPWGVSVPNDESQIIYVWFDALLNYIFAAGYLTDNFEWDNVIQICGPDNLRFQGLIFQSFLEAENIKKTDKLLVHGTILDSDGKKISKSIGNIIDPIDQLNKFGLDAVRYYALSGISNYYDSNWSEKDLINSYNSDICNDWGNLISRVVHLINIKNHETDSPEKDFKKNIDSKVIEINDLWNEFKIREAIQKTNEVVKFANKYINDEKPWKSDNTIVLDNLYYLIENINLLYYPVFPKKYEIIKKCLKDKEKIIFFEKII